MNQQTNEQHGLTLSDALKAWHQQLLLLSQYDDQDSMLKAALVSCRLVLRLDRIGFLLLNEQQDSVQGGWGVDAKGEIVSIHHYRQALSVMEWSVVALQDKEFVSTRHDVDLMHMNQKVGRGWNAMCGLWDGDHCFGWMAVDDLLQPQQAPIWAADLLGIIGQGLGRLLGRLQQQQAMHELNLQLEQQVQQRNRELESQVDTLKRLEHEYLRSERLASIGNLVAGVAHEISTPLGNSLTALSLMNERLHQLLHSFNQKQLTQSQLGSGLQQLQQSQLLIEQALLRAKKIVQDFRQIADYQTHTCADIIWLKTLVDNILASHHNQLKRRPIRIDNQISDGLHFFDDPSDLTFIVTSLLNNSLSHAFAAEDEGQIIIQAELQQEWLLLSFIDSGRGVPEAELERIFEPFTQLHATSGHSGMGLSTVSKLVAERQGYINAYANHPQGLIIVIRLPLGEDHESQQ